MKAVMVHEYGGPEVLKFEEVADPKPKAGEVMIHVAATSVNPFDLMRRSGIVKEQAPIEFPGIVGVDVAGTVASLGLGVDAFAVGDKVFGMTDRTYAELCVAPAASLVKIPTGIDLVDAAAIPLVTTTGNMLMTSTGIKAGQTVLVTGAIGNVGRSAVYTAKSLGATVIAAVLKRQIGEAAHIGADQLIATDDLDAMENLPMLDAVADAVAGKTAELLIAKVKPGGVFATVLDPPANAKEFAKVNVVAVYAQPDAKVLSFMANAVRDGKLSIPIGKKMPLSDAAKAHESISQGLIHGKVLLVAEGFDEGANLAEEAIKTLLSSYNEALNDSKTDKVLPLYAEDGIFMPPFSSSAIGLKAIRKAYDEVFVTRKFDVIFQLAELVVMSPNWAYARTNSAGHTTNPQSGVQSSEGNQELFLFNKGADGAWKIARYSFSPTNPPK
jgi:uncharacterized protein (TIGR02246 family)